MDRSLETPQGRIEYQLTRKRVKNLNLRISPDGQVKVSAPQRLPMAQVEGFLRQRAAWIIQHQAAVLARPAPAPCAYTREECLAIFTAVSDAIFPLFADLLGGEKPLLRVREMKTRWGVCNPRRRTITLNPRLAEKPREALEYVVLHEYVHFLHPNHQAGFHGEMARLMPDYRRRRELLK